MASVSTDRRYGVNSGMAIKVPCKAATTANITLSGEQTIDGVSCVTSDRVLVKNQTTTTENGVYVVDTGSWTRDRDFDGAYDVTQGTLIPVVSGASAIGSIWQLVTSSPVIGSTALAFSKFIGTMADFAASAGSLLIGFIQAGTGAVARTVQAELRDWVKVRQFASGNGTDETVGLRAAFLEAATTGRTLYIQKHSSGIGYMISGPLYIPITTRDFTIVADPGTVIYNTGNDFAIDIGDNTTENDRAWRIAIRELQIQGTGWTDSTKPNQGGIRARGYLGLVLDNVYVQNVPADGIVLDKSQAANSAYANNTLLTGVKVRYTGKKSIKAGSVYALDDFNAIGCLFNNAGALESASTEGGVYVGAATVDIGGCEVSAMTNYKSGMVVRRASGLVHGCHYENNGNNVADSADLFLDTDANGLVVSGTNHSCNYSTAAKYGVRTNSADNVIQGVMMDGGATHVLDAVVKVSDAKRAVVFNVGTKDATYKPNHVWVHWNNPAEAALVVTQGSVKEPESFDAQTHTVADTAVSAANDTITITGHSFTEGDNCYITGAGVAPTGLSFNMNYYVNVVDADTIKLRPWEAGATIDITAAGTGPFNFIRITYGSVYLLRWASGSDAYINVPIKLASTSYLPGSWKALIAPHNQAAATAMGSSKCPYVATLNYQTNTLGINIATADATGVGTNTQWIVRITPA